VAVVKAHAFAKVEDESLGIGLIPTLGERRREMEIPIAGHEAIEEQFVDVLRKCIASDARIETGRAALDDKYDGVGIALRGTAAGEKREEEKQDRASVQQKQPQSEMEPMFHPENMKIRRRLAPSNLKELAESLGQILRLRASGATLRMTT